jgi:predicted helicase
MQGGVVAFVTNGSYIDSNTADGLRLTLADEFHHLYVFNLRGNQRTAGEVSRKEGGKIFDAGSRNTVAIMLLVKQPSEVSETCGTIHYQDIGDYLTRLEKLDLLAAELPAVDDAVPALSCVGWTTIQPNEHGDWINQRAESFQSHLAMAPGSETSVFSLHTNGLKTNRDAWNYNSSLPALESNVSSMIGHYNTQVNLFAASHPGAKGSLRQRAELARSIVDFDPRRFSWDRSNFRDPVRGTRYGETDRLVMTATYRPFPHG